MSSHSAPTRTSRPSRALPSSASRPKELLKSYRAGKDAAVAEVERFDWKPTRARWRV